MTREQSRQQTRERLLDAAAQVFAEQGVNGASVEQIAERAGYSRGAFHGNFKDKDQLVAALLERRTQIELEEVRALTQDASSPAEAMDRLRAWNIERARHLDDWLALRLELLLHALRHPEVRSVMAERERTARTALAGGIAQSLAERGAESPAEPLQLALIVHALEDGLLLQRMLSPDEIADDIVVDAFELLISSWTALGRQP